jgi:hypothetical protein
VFDGLRLHRRQARPTRVRARAHLPGCCPRPTVIRPNQRPDTDRFRLLGGGPAAPTRVGRAPSTGGPSPARDLGAAPSYQCDKPAPISRVPMHHVTAAGLTTTCAGGWSLGWVARCRCRPAHPPLDVQRRRLTPRRVRRTELGLAKARFRLSQVDVPIGLLNTGTNTGRDVSAGSRHVFSPSPTRAARMRCIPATTAYRRREVGRGRPAQTWPAGLGPTSRPAERPGPTCRRRRRLRVRALYTVRPARVRSWSTRVPRAGHAGDPESPGPGDHSSGRVGVATAHGVDRFLP